MTDATPQAVQACHELLVWLIPQLDKFPRARRFTLGDRLEGALLEVLELLVDAAYSRSKQGALARLPTPHPVDRLRRRSYHREACPASPFEPCRMPTSRPSSRGSPWCGRRGYFGSRARGEARRESDLDVAVLLDPGAPPDVLTRLSGALSQQCGVEVDVVDIARSTPVLGFEIVSGGRRVFTRDAEAADDAEERCLRTYLDTAHMRRVQHHYLYGDPL